MTLLVALAWGFGIAVFVTIVFFTCILAIDSDRLAGGLVPVFWLGVILSILAYGIGGGFAP